MADNKAKTSKVGEVKAVLDTMIETIDNKVAAVFGGGGGGGGGTHTHKETIGKMKAAGVWANKAGMDANNRKVVETLEKEGPDAAWLAMSQHPDGRPWESYGEMRSYYG
jgi:hypothetical protein